MKKLFASQSISLKENRLCFLESAPASESAAESPEKKLEALVKTVQTDFDQMKKDFDANKAEVDKIIDKEADIIKRNFPLIVESIVAKGKEFDQQTIELNNLIKDKKYKEAEAKIKDLRERLKVILQLGHGWSAIERNVEKAVASEGLKTILEAGRAKSRESADKIEVTFKQIEKTLKAAESATPSGEAPAVLPAEGTETGDARVKREEKEKRDAEAAKAKADRDAAAAAQAEKLKADKPAEASEAEKATLKAREVAKAAEEVAKKAEEVARTAGTRQPDASKGETKSKKIEKGEIKEGIFNKDGNLVEGTITTKGFTKKGKWDKDNNFEGTYIDREVTLKGKFNKDRLEEGIREFDDETQEGTFEYGKNAKGDFEFKKVLKGTITFKKDEKYSKVEWNKDNVKIFFKDGKIYEGKRIDSKDIRVGIITYPDGHKEKGKWDKEWNPVGKIENFPAGTAVPEEEPAPDKDDKPDKDSEKPAKDDDKPDKGSDDASAEAKEVNMKGRLTLPDLQAKLKEIKVEATEEQIKKAFKYYALDYNDEKGYVDGDEKTKTKEILDGVKQLIKDGKIKKENLAYIGSVDGTHYLLKKVLKQSKKWHEEKRDALEVLLGFISNNSVIFYPSDKAPDEATQKLIKDYIGKVGSDLDGAKRLVKDNESAFTEKQGIFNMALAVQRAKDIKARVLDNKKARLDSSTDIIRIELGEDDDTPPDRKSGLLLLDANGGIIKPERDTEIPIGEGHIKGEKDADEQAEPAEKLKKHPKRKLKGAIKGEVKGAVVKIETTSTTPVQGGTGTIDRSKGEKLPPSHDQAAQEKAKPAEQAKAPATPEKVQNPTHKIIIDTHNFEWIIVKQKNGTELGYRIGFQNELSGNAVIKPGTDYVTFTIGDKTLDMDFRKPTQNMSFTVGDHADFLSMYSCTQYGNKIVFGILPESAQWKKHWLGEMNAKTGLNLVTWVGKVYDNIDLKKEEQNLLNGLNAVPKANKDYINSQCIKIALNKNEYFGKEDIGLNEKMDMIIINYWKSKEKITETVNAAVAKHKEKNKKQEPR